MHVERWFNYLKEALCRYNVPMHNVYNMDETGFQMGYSQKEQVIFNRRTGPPLSVTTGTTQWVTSIECICADGPPLQPLDIHRGKVPNQLMDRWFPALKFCPN